VGRQWLIGRGCKKNLKIYLSTEAENSPPHLTVKGLSPAAVPYIQREKNVKKFSEKLNLKVGPLSSKTIPVFIFNISQ
jgi:hypothetical protein